MDTDWLKICFYSSWHWKHQFENPPYSLIDENVKTYGQHLDFPFHSKIFSCHVLQTRISRLLHSHTHRHTPDMPQQLVNNLEGD